MPGVGEEAQYSEGELEISYTNIKQVYLLRHLKEFKQTNYII
jgi:hypothetical protein